jgi:hypothetical protein
MKETLLKWKTHFEEIAGNWNGEDTQGEEVAQHALDCLEHINALLELTEEN